MWVILRPPSLWLRFLILRVRHRRYSYQEIEIAIRFLTPIVGMLVALVSAGISLPWFPAPNPHLLDSWLVTVLVVVMAASIVFLGPGAFSLDSRLFGRREIFIPPAPRLPKS